MASGQTEDPALETLFLPMLAGDVAWPADGSTLFLRARPGWPLARFREHSFVCEQSWFPHADALQRAGFETTTAAEGRFSLVLALPPRQREEARALLARAVSQLAPGGVLVASMANNEGARSGEDDLQRLAGPVNSFSKNKCRVFRTDPAKMQVDAELLAEWSGLDAPRRILEGRYVSRPGLFAWNRIDPASALLAARLPSDLAGHGADLGAGYGYLASEVLARCPGVTALHLYEAEARALEVARINLDPSATGRPDVELAFHWCDVAAGLPRCHDFIVTNPPFHEGRAGVPELGRRFIAAAATALAPHGRLWLVANRHLPYEAELQVRMESVRKVCEEQGFKVIEAVKGMA